MTSWRSGKSCAILHIESINARTFVHIVFVLKCLSPNLCIAVRVIVHWLQHGLSHAIDICRDTNTRSIITRILALCYFTLIMSHIVVVRIRKQSNSHWPIMNSQLDTIVAVSNWIASRLCWWKLKDVDAFLSSNGIVRANMNQYYGCWCHSSARRQETGIWANICMLSNATLSSVCESKPQAKFQYQEISENT